MYFKILRENLTHHGFTYKKGLNVDVKPFDLTPECDGGLFFADEKHILEFCDYGMKIAEVTLPEGEEVVQVEEKYKAHSIILGKIYDLWTVETFEWLLKCGVDIHTDNDYALIGAARNGYLEVVKYLVEQEADIHADNDCALRWAAENGHLRVVKYLVEHGANIHADNDCVLRWAAEEGHLEVVKYLVEHGANIHAKKDYALRWADLNNHLEVVKYLESLESGN